MVKTSGEMDPIQLAWMVNQMESYKPDAAAPSAFPLAGRLFLGTVASFPSGSPTAQGRWGPAVA
ncbi:MAG: hypothetical protein ACQESR_29845, partial [Planctomycetota bacterium]